MAAKSKVDWSAVEAAIRKGDTIAKVSRDCNVSRKAIYERMNADAANGKSWLPPKTEHATPSNVIPFGARGSRKKAPAGGSRPKTVTSTPAPAADPPRGEGSAWFALDDANEPRIEGEDGLTNPVDQHQLTAALLLAATNGMLRKLIKGKLVPGMNQSAATVYKEVVAGAGRAIELSREVAGLRPGVRSDDASRPATKQRRLRFVIPPDPRIAAPPAPDAAVNE